MSSGFTAFFDVSGLFWGSLVFCGFLSPERGKFAHLSKVGDRLN